MNRLAGFCRSSALDQQQVRKESIRRSSACARRSAPGSSSAMYPACRKIWGPARRCIETEPQSTRVIDQMCRLPLQSAPGDQLRYSNAGYGVIARLDGSKSPGSLSGKSHRTVCSSHSAFKTSWLTPAGPHCTGLHISPTRVIPERTSRPTTARIGEAWHCRGADSSARHVMLSALRPRFFPPETRVLSEAATSLMTTDQTMGVPGGVESAKVHWSPGRWGLGWEVKGEKRRHWTGDYTSNRTFCHFGHAGTLLWGDPERDLALAVFTNRAVTHMWGFILPRWQRLSNAVVAAASVNQPVCQ